MDIDEKIKSVENEVFKKTNVKIDSYTLAVIRAGFLAVEETQLRNKEENEKFRKFAGIYVWGSFAALTILVLFTCITVLRNYTKHEFIENVVKYDESEKYYYIDSKDYRIENDKKDKKVKRVILKNED